MTCDHCRALFTPSNLYQRFCSASCRIADHDDVDKGDPNLPAMTHAEIAAVLGVSRATVQADEARAMEKLRAVLGAET